MVAAADASGDTGGAGSDGGARVPPVITRGDRKQGLSSGGKIAPKMSNSPCNMCSCSEMTTVTWCQI